MPSKRACTGTTKAGNPCKAPPRADALTCISHSSKQLQRSAGFGGAQVGGGRPKTPRVVDLIRERYEEEIDAWYQVLLDARIATKPVGVGEGEDFRVIHTPDHTTRLAAFREVNDRVYGRPRQALEHSGPDGKELRVTVPMDPDRERDLTMILVQTGAIQLPSNGNGDLPDIDG